MLLSSRKPEHEITQEINYIKIQAVMIRVMCQLDRDPGFPAVRSILRLGVSVGVFWKGREQANEANQMPL